MKVKKNLSEELVINDDISLGSLNCDEEECKKELEKEIEDHEKEVNKELADKVKDVEEINEFEAKPVEIHDGEDKKVKIKGLTEKLTLEEPSDVLNESADIEEILFDLREQCISDIHNELHSYLKHCEYANIDYPYSTKEDAIDALESICEEAIYHMDDILDNSGMLTEEVLDEKIPKDLAKAYKGASYRGRSGANTDLENSTYEVIDDPDKAYKLYKQDPRSVRLLFNGQLIDFRDDGRPSDVHRNQWLGNDKMFTNRNGKAVRDTMYIPPKELFRRADKIYLTNEHTPEGRKDQAKLDARKENPESPNSSIKRKLNDYGFGASRWRYNSDKRRGSPDTSSTEYSIKRDQRYLDSLKTELAHGDETGDYGWRGRDGILSRMKEYEDSIAKNKSILKDSEARLRYANSEIALQKPIERFVELRSNVSDLRDRAESAERDLNNVKTNGSRSSRENRERLKDLQDEIKRLQRKVAMVELNLEETDEEDAKAVAAADRKYQAALAEFNSAQAEIDRLLRRNQ